MSALEAMRAHLDATLPDSVTVRIGDMTGVSVPRVSAWGPPINRETDRALAELGHSEVVGITCTAANEQAALGLARAAIEALTPGLMPRRLGDVTFDFVSSQNATTDRSMTLPGTNSHPAYVTAQFRAHTQPSKEPA